MPLNRTPATHYLRCRYKLVRKDIEYGQFGNYTVTADGTTITTIN